ncbi:MAG TPA: hypothetical protein VFZ01_02490 [Geminicoccaceae bacterium]
MKPEHTLTPGRLLPAIVFAGALLAASPAFAYVGPGAGLTAIGSVIALVGAIGLAIVGFLWYPIKRLRRRRQGVAAKPGEKPVEKPAG